MPKILEEYNRKRNFGRTPEPEGEPDGQDREALRFVVQHHIASRDHFDFRLEWNGTLLSWAVPKGLSYNPRDKRLAIQVEDHPIEYRNFEGTIPKGEYGGGTVMLWDEGWWEPQSDVDAGLARGSLKFVLKGQRLKGKWALVRLKAKEGESKNNWLLMKEKDEYAREDDGIGNFATSVRTGRTMDEIETREDDKISVVTNPFDRTDVQLAKLAGRIPEGDGWLYELKYDGYRILAYIEGGSARLVTRNGSDYTDKFRDIAYSLTDWAAGRSRVLDGEMVVADEQGRTDFQALQSYLKNHGSKSLTYIIFDLLALDGEDLRGRRLIERKGMLEALMKDAPKNLYYSRHVRGNGDAAFRAACEKNMEGIVGKKADSVYSGTRNGDWIKIKCDTRQEFVIGGYALSAKKTSGVSSILLGVYEGDELVYAGRAGTGFSERTMGELEERFKSIKRDTPPFKSVPAARKGERITWLEPVLVAEIKFAEWTDENQLRQASFKGLRIDKDPREVRREAIAERGMQSGKTDVPADGTAGNETVRVVKEGRNLFIGGIRISNPDRIIFEDPEVKKVDVVKYYAQAAERMLPYVGNRILSVVRCHKGVTETCFFKKHPGADNKGIITVPVENSGGETKEYFCIENVYGLISEAQMGTLEFHTWGSRADDIERPDVMVFDLDPDVGMDPGRVRDGVRDLKSILDQLGLVSYLKTSGGKGYHVVVPFAPSADWDRFSGFARQIAEVMEQKWPDRYTSNIRKDKRRDRIFIDWIRNGRGATSIAPYSLRARKGAPVSMPISWDELDSVAPDGINMEQALSRMSGSDPWEGFYQTGQRLS
jgi:bifunctional non-homologous end joining protein LigD